MFLKCICGTSLVVQWMGVCLPMRGTRARCLGPVNSTCLRATKPLRHTYWAHALELWATAPEPVCQNCWGLHAWIQCSTIREGTTIRNPHLTRKNSPCSLQLEKAHTQQWRPSAAKRWIKNQMYLWAENGHLIRNVFFFHLRLLLISKTDWIYKRHWSPI